MICKGNLFQCRTRLCGWCSFIGDLPYHVLKRFQCRTRLCGWCSSEKSRGGRRRRGFQCRTRLCGWCSLSRNYLAYDSEIVSMPHAALWVVQQLWNLHWRIRFSSFNAARGFVGGAARTSARRFCVMSCFNAARGFVGGAASSLSALVPLRGKSPFGKSPEI